MIIETHWLTELLDTINGTWYTCNDLPVVNCHFRATIVSDTLYLLEGYDVAKAKPSLQVFAASLDTLSSHHLKWQSLPDTPWCYSTPVVLYKKFLFSIGGRQPSNVNSQTDEVCIFNPTANQWRPIANIPVATSGPAVVGVADNKLIVLGGMTKGGNFSTEVWIGVFEP